MGLLASAPPAKPRGFSYLRSDLVQRSEESKLLVMDMQSTNTKERDRKGGREGGKRFKVSNWGGIDVGDLGLRYDQYSTLVRSLYL